MYIVEKVLNNNAILAYHSQNQEKVVLIKLGIGFGVKVGDTLPQQEHAQVYVYFDERNKRGDIVYQIDAQFLEIASTIIENLKRDFESVKDDRMLALADHIAFAYERIKNGQSLPNPFNEQVKLLYSMEYRYAVEAGQLITSVLGILVDEDELGYLTLHIHAMLSAQEVTRSMETARVLKQCMDRIEEWNNVKLNPSSLEYLRIMTHLKWLVIRAEKKEVVALDITNMVKEQYPNAYQLALELKGILNRELRLEIKEEEVGYLGIHIQRMLISHT